MRIFGRMLGLRKSLMIACGWGLLWLFTSLIWGQSGLWAPPAPADERVPNQRSFTPFPAISPSDGSLGEFYPIQDTVLDSAAPFWNGKRVRLARTIESGAGRAIFDVTAVYIPEGVTVKVKNYDYVVFNATGDIVIDGDIDATGSNLVIISAGGDITIGGGAVVSADGGAGSHGSNGQSGVVAAGGNGGDGGDGGDADGPGGAGLGGGGGGGRTAGQDGAPGAGPDSPGQPQYTTTGSRPRPSGGGSAGGSNGTRGARGLGDWSNGFYTPRDPFGPASIGLTPAPSGGGSGAAGGWGVWTYDTMTGAILGQGTGAGGAGGGGGGGVIFIEAADGMTTVSGTVRANGGNGGNGGNGAPNSFPVPGAEGGDGGGGGGGGAGGFIGLAGKKVTVNGTLEARGGQGGGRGAAGSATGSFPGFLGGPGGGGRIAAFASNGVTGLTASNGTNATSPSGTTPGTPGQPTIFVGVKVDSITFDYDRSSGLDLRIDGNTAISTPEWEVNTKEKPPSQMPYDNQTAAPAAYIMTNPLKFQAQFSAGTTLARAVIKATLTLASGDASPFGDLMPQTVNFTNGQSGPVTFTSERAARTITANDVTFNWQVVSGTTTNGQTVGPFDINQTTHRIYTVFRLPVAPMTVAWAKVLELTCGMAMAAGLTEAQLTDAGADTLVVRTLADGLFYSKWRDFRYNVRFYDPTATYVYSPSVCRACGSLLNQTYPLQSILTMLENMDLVMQCTDNADWHSILAASQGIDAKPMLIQNTDDMGRPILMAPTAPYTRAGETVCRVDRFNYHQVGSLNLLYDTSGRCALDTMSAACMGRTLACTPGDNFFDLNREDYMGTVFPTQDFARTYFNLVTVTVGTCP